MKDVLKRAKAILANTTATSTEEEFAYFIAKLEIDEGTYSEGLMSKAFSKARQHGDVKHAIYIELRATQLLQDTTQALKQLRVEWEDAVRQQELREKKLEEQRLKHDYGIFKEQQAQRHDAYSLYENEDEILKKLEPGRLLQDNQNQYELPEALAWVFLVFSGFIAIPLWNKGQTSNCIISLSICVLFALIIGFIYWRKRIITQKLKMMKFEDLENTHSEIQNSISAYESELKKHPGYSLVDAKKPD